MKEILRNAWRIKELRNKILFTIGALIIYRLGAQIFVPFVNTALFSQAFEEQWADSALGLLNIMSGGGFARASIFALSIQPYINASIIMNLLTVGIPALERLQKEGGEEGRKKIAAITRYATVLLGLLLGWGNYTLIRSMGALTDEGVFAAVVIILTLTAGSAFIMWMGEQVTEFGVGNGISVVLLASIVSRGFPTVNSAYVSLVDGTLQWWALMLILLFAVAAVTFVVYITNAERRIPIQYSKRMVGRKMYGGQSSHLPLKVNMSGVMPIIFATSLVSLPATVAAFFPAVEKGVEAWFGPRSALYAIIYFILIIGFSYFYQAIQFNPIEIANNLRQNGGFVPGLRPGKPTSEFIRKSLNKITLFGAIFLSIIAVTPIIMDSFLSVSGLALGGTSLLIVVGVSLETVRAIESQMLMRNYKGFLE